MKIRFLGHAAFSVHLDSGRHLLIDPFLTGNPSASAKLDDFPDVDLVLLTHDHDDHGPADAVELCKKSGATLVSSYEIAKWGEEQGLTVEPMGIGGKIDLDGLVVHMVNAQHSTRRGRAAGFVLESDGQTVYFAGDTGLFGDMKLFGEQWDLDLAVLPVGDRFTMGPESAARAVDMLRPKHVIPCHYGTFPIILPDASKFVELAGDLARIHALAPGETLEL